MLPILRSPAANPRLLRCSDPEELAERGEQLKALSGLTELVELQPNAVVTETRDRASVWT